MVYLLYFAIGITMLLALAGCVIPVIPGPTLAFVAYLFLYLTDAGSELTTAQTAILGGLTIATVVIDYIIPAIGVKMFGGTTWGKWGCLIGSILGLFFMPVGLLLGPFLGAFVGELMGNSSTSDAFRSGIGSLIGFLLGTVFKFVVTIYIVYCAFSAIF